MMLSDRFFLHFLIRVPMILCFYISLITRRFQLGSSSAMSSGFFITFIIVSFETLSYLTSRTHVRLNLNLFRVYLHQEQLVNLLDSVPDMVMISQQKESSFRSKDDIFYANHKLGEFFGSQPDSSEGDKNTL